MEENERSLHKGLNELELRKKVGNGPIKVNRRFISGGKSKLQIENNAKNLEFQR